MSDYSVDSVSAFMAVGKRYSLDIKLHGMGISTILVQIDEKSFDLFIERWQAAQADVIRTVNAFFGPTLVARPLQLVGSVRKTVQIVPPLETLLLQDRESLMKLRYATDVDSFEYHMEAFSALAEFVHHAAQDRILAISN